MLCIKDFKEQGFKDKTMEIHTEISLAVSAQMKCHDHSYRKTSDQHWLAKGALKEALKVLDCLDLFLEKGRLEDYLEQHAILWGLLEELGLSALIGDRISKKFGTHCFFIVLHRECSVSF